MLVGEVVEAAVVPVADEINGKVPDLYIALTPCLAPSTEIANNVSNAVVEEIGAIARPCRVIIVPDMPKTRSGKSCGASWRRSRTARISATCRRSRIRRSSTRSESRRSREGARRQRVTQRKTAPAEGDFCLRGWDTSVSASVGRVSSSYSDSEGAKGVPPRRTRANAARPSGPNACPCWPV